MVAGARQDHYSYVAIFGRIGKRAVEFLEQRRRLRVTIFRPIERDFRDAIGFVVDQVAVGHALLLPVALRQAAHIELAPILAPTASRQQAADHSPRLTISRWIAS